LNNLPLELRPNPTAWDELLQKALPALDHVFPPDSALTQRQPEWTLGGGTALALRIAHRLSDDVDLFVPSRPLKVFTPSENPGSKAISQQFQWPGHYLKFECKGGEIDFLSPHLQTTPGFTWERYRNRDIALETLAEVIVKKIRFRSARFTTRDIFDLAAVGKTEPKIISVLASEVYDALPRLKTVIQERSRISTRLGIEIRPTKKFEGAVSQLKRNSGFPIFCIKHLFRGLETEASAGPCV
jgi:hypothetical protein